MDTSGMGKPDMVKELNNDIARKYQIHGTKVEQIWRSFDRSQRARAMKAGAAEGVVLKHPKDGTLGNVYKVVPELNLRDITEPGSDYLLDLLKHRATKSLSEQYREGVNGDLGDHQFILKSMRFNNLRHVRTFKYCFTLFMDEDKYGESYEVMDAARYKETMAGLSVAVEAGLCVPQSTGELILERQLMMLQALTIMVDDILEGGSTTRNTSARPKKPAKAARDTFSKLSIVEKPEKLSIPGLLASALDQKSSLDDYLDLCCTEPVFLAHVINNWFFSNPELVKDEKGRTMPVITDRYISIAFFETIHNAVTGAALWDFLCRLLQLLVDGSNDQLYRGIILQEVSNVCHMEYDRVRKLFKRHVQTGSGSKYFKRVSGKYDNGIARVTMKGNPEMLTRENPQLHYMLRLCQSETDASKALAWIKKLDELHRSHPDERENMEEREYDSFSDLAVIAGFIQSLSASLPLPPISLKKGQIYVSRLKELGAELEPLKTQVDLSNFVVPIDNLLEPGMAEGALKSLDQFIVDKTGTKMGFLYQSLVEDCVEDLQDYCQEQKAKAEQNAEAELAALAIAPFIEAPSPEVRIQQRQEKDKTRPAHSSVYDTSPATATPQPDTTETPPIFRVKQDTIEVFLRLFSKSESRGSVSWTAFEAAMTDLNFSIMPKFGSVFTFFPPQSMGVQKSFTVHRPHKSRIEGYKLLFFASRLKRVYGWGEESFEAT